MSFADTYLSRYSYRRVKQLPGPNPELLLTIVIPVYNEPHFPDFLKSLLDADPPGIIWEIIIIVNEPEDCPADCHLQNLNTIEIIATLSSTLGRDDLNIHIIDPGPFPRKKAGAGLARRIGMDEAVRRYNDLDRPDGIIVSLDADTSCSTDYLEKLARFFLNEPGAGGCTVYFEHIFHKTDIPDAHQLNAIINYELYLRYLRLSLEWMGHPFAVHSLGSAFAVRASRYVLAGGMGLKLAGEDFHFLQKCLPHGDFWELNNTSVFPSARASDRVIFGTGPFISRFMGEGKQIAEVYSFDLFRSLRPLFKLVNSLKRIPRSYDVFEKLIANMPAGIQTVMKSFNWEEKISSSINECAALDSFVKRFYHEISLLQLIRLFNELSGTSIPRETVTSGFSSLMRELGIPSGPDKVEGMLNTARMFEKSRGVIKIS